MKEAIQWLDKNLEVVLCVFLMSIMTIVIFIQVIMRYVFSSSLVWSEEFARYCFIWLVFLGGSYGCKQRAHIRIDAALKLFPEKLRSYVVILGDMSVLLLASYMFVTGISLMLFQIAHNKVSPAMGVPMALVNLAVPVGFGLIMLRQVQAVFKQAAGPDNAEEREVK